MENRLCCILPQTDSMKFDTGALIVVLGVTACLTIGFARVAHGGYHGNTRIPAAAHKHISPRTVGQIPLPQGFTRTSLPQGSYGGWLRNFPLRRDNTVYLYNGQPIEDQRLHYAVLDISTGTKDLQQCADAIMRLRAEYYFSRGAYGKIEFIDGKTKYNFGKYLSSMVPTSDRHTIFMGFMENVFINCGTYTVDAMSNPILLSTMQPGDMFVKAGSPGHAMVVVDVATNAEGKKIYLLAQGFMPAQDMHIVINPMNPTLSPWYEITNEAQITTPGWVFGSKQLKRWD